MTTRVTLLHDRMRCRDWGPRFAVMASLFKSRSFYFGAAAGIGGAYYLNRTRRLSITDSSPVVEGLSKTERLSGMDWQPPSRAVLVNRLKGYTDAGDTKLADDQACFDLLIIGGGATGTGCALDAASRGLKVACVEKGDFACGTLPILCPCIISCRNQLQEHQTSSWRHPISGEGLHEF